MIDARFSLSADLQRHVFVCSVPGADVAKIEVGYPKVISDGTFYIIFGSPKIMGKNKC
jgi:hypothetical protein